VTTYELTVEHVKDDVMRCVTPSGHEVVMDSLGEPAAAGPTPVELLAVSVAACSLMDIASILAKRRLEFRDLKGHVVAERREQHPRAFTAIHVRFEVAGEVPEADLDRACRLSVEKYCSVMATVREAPPITWEGMVVSA